MPNCVIYCRVSTEEQAEQGYSLDAQEKLCRDFAERSSYRVVGVYRDEGKSATNLNRPALTELLSKCTENAGLSAVIVQETDRLARNTKDHLTIKAVLKKAGVKLISTAQPMLDDSPEGMMVDTILASVNQFQSDLNGRKTKRGMQERFEQGWWPGWAPLGYLNVATGPRTDEGKGEKLIVKDPARWDVLREGFDLYLVGDRSADEVNDLLYDKGLRAKSGKKLAHSIIVKILRNPFYAGLMQWDGQQRQGKHPAMISVDEHKRVLQIMASHNLHACRRRKHNFLLRGFLVCDICGGRYTGEIHPAKQKAYYHCTAGRKHSNRGQNAPLAALERQVEQRFKGVQFSEEFAGMIVSGLKAAYSDQKQARNARKHTLYNQQKTIEAKRDKAEEKLLNGVLSDEAFVRLRTRFAGELATVRDQVDELNREHECDTETVQQVLRLSRDVYRAYRDASEGLKRHYLGLFWDRFVVRDRRIVKAIPTELIQNLRREKYVIIRTTWCPSPRLIRTLMDWKYMKELKDKLQNIALSLRTYEISASSPACSPADPERPAQSDGRRCLGEA